MVQGSRIQGLDRRYYILNISIADSAETSVQRPGSLARRPALSGEGTSAKRVPGHPVSWPYCTDALGCRRASHRALARVNEKPMPKSRSIFVCNECGAESPQYYGRCPTCGSWNSMVEQAQPAKETTSARASALGRSRGTATKPSQPRLAMTLGQIEDHPQTRLPSGYGELDRVLGGGIVPGSLVLLGGDPGIGKSTLLLQTADQLSRRMRVLYVCAEESGQQVKLRWQRLGPVGGEGWGVRGWGEGEG